MWVRSGVHNIALMQAAGVRLAATHICSIHEFHIWRQGIIRLAGSGIEPKSTGLLLQCPAY